MKQTWTGLDFETSSRNKYTCEFVGLGLGRMDMATGEIRDLRYITDKAELRGLEISEPVVMHNASFDQHLCERWGVELFGPVHDTFLMAKHVDNLLPAYDLKSLSWYFFRDTYLPRNDMVNWMRNNLKVSPDDPDEFDLSDVPPELVSAYCLHDVEATLKLAHFFMQKLAGSYGYDLDKDIIQANLDMEQWGVPVSVSFYRDFIRRGRRRIRYNRKQAKSRMELEDGANPMGDALREHLEDLGEKRTTKTKKVRADDVVLREWEDEDPAVGSVMRVRRDEKSVGTYVKNILAVAQIPPVQSFKRKGIGLFHANFVQSGAVTRRYRCRGFYGDNGQIAKGNMQNFNDEMREGVVPRPGFDLYKMDLASIEARMFSSYLHLLCGSSVFRDEYVRSDSFNPYLFVIEKCTGEGKVSKKHPLYTPYKHGTLGRLYGSSPQRFSIQLREDFNLKYTKEQCEEIYRSIDRAFPFIRDFQRMLTRLVEKQGFVLDPFGCVYRVPEGEEYKVVAYLCQGSAGVVLKWWWREIERERVKWGDHIFNTVHDEFDMELDRTHGRTRRRAERYGNLLSGLDLFDLPILAEVIGPLANWAEA